MYKQTCVISLSLLNVKKEQNPFNIWVRTNEGNLASPLL